MHVEWKVRHVSAPPVVRMSAFAKTRGTNPNGATATTRWRCSEKSWSDIEAEPQ